MRVNGQNRDATGAGGVLRWSGKVVTADGLQQSLNGERELVVTPRTVITPLAADHLKANGVQVVRQEEAAKPLAGHNEKSNGGWGYILERPFPLAGSVMQSLKRDGMNLHELSIPRQSEAECETLAGALARHAAQVVSRGDSLGAIVFCLDPLLICCVANKVKGIRASALASPAQANRAVSGLGVNFLALEIGKQTFFELRQILRSVCGSPATCSGAVAGILKELEGSCQCGPKAHGPQSVGLENKCQCGGGHAHR
jgi:ribose 5-phosphate isomerase RpiB